MVWQNWKLSMRSKVSLLKKFLSMLPKSCISRTKRTITEVSKKFPYPETPVTEGKLRQTRKGPPVGYWEWS